MEEKQTIEVDEVKKIILKMLSSDSFNRDMKYGMRIIMEEINRKIVNVVKL